MVRTPDRPIEASVEASNHHHPAGRGAGGGLAPDRLARALQLIEESHGATLLVADIARHVNMSPFHFARMFKLSTGYSPHSYLTVRRIERAKGMLERTSLPLAEIARAVGSPRRRISPGCSARKRAPRRVLTGWARDRPQCRVCRILRSIPRCRTEPTDLSISLGQDGLHGLHPLARASPPRRPSHLRAAYAWVASLMLIIGLGFSTAALAAGVTRIDVLAMLFGMGAAAALFALVVWYLLQLRPRSS
jgi:AraC-like DNA-binding protein